MVTASPRWRTHGRLTDLVLPLGNPVPDEDGLANSAKVISRCPSKQCINWWAKTHDVQRREAQSKHLATAKTGSLALQAVQVAEFHPLLSPTGVDAGASCCMCSVDEKSLKRLLDEDEDDEEDADDEDP